jgi:DNA-3-methyladenine glycosylase II
MKASLILVIAFVATMAKAKMSKTATRAAKSIKLAKVATTATKLTPAVLNSVLMEAETLPQTRGGWRICEGLKHLISVDKRFSDLIGAHGIPMAFLPGSTRPGGFVPLPVPSGVAEEHYFSLLKTIIYQQLSAKSAEPILNRFLSAFNVSNGPELTPQMVSQAKFETTFVDGKKKVLVNGIVSGLSEGKARYIKDLTDHYLDPNKLKGVNLATLTDEELRSKLLQVNGLGPWSVDMFMLFDLHRPNVLPMGDLVVRKGVARFLGLPEKHFDNKKNLSQVTELCKGWAPYSSLATCYMWKVKDSLTVVKEE